MRVRRGFGPPHPCHARSRSRDEHDLAAHVATLDQAVSLGDVVEGEGAFDVDQEASVVYEARDCLEADLIRLDHDPPEGHASSPRLIGQLSVQRIDGGDQDPTGAQDAD